MVSSPTVVSYVTAYHGTAYPETAYLLTHEFKFQPQWIIKFEDKIIPGNRADGLKNGTHRINQYYI